MWRHLHEGEVRCLPCDDDEAGARRLSSVCMTTHTRTNVMHAHCGDTMDPYLASWVIYLSSTEKLADYTTFGDDLPVMIVIVARMSLSPTPTAAPSYLHPLSYRYRLTACRRVCRG